MADIRVSSNALVSLNVTSTANSFGVERRFDRGTSIADLKLKLELITGAFAQSMKLSAYNSENQLICVLDNDEALLGSYPLDDGMRLHAEDSTVKSDEYLDTSKVEKFEISEEEYEKRTDSVKAFKERNKLGRFNEELVKQKEAEQKAKEEMETEKAKGIHENDRCEVAVAGQPSRRGTVKFVGTTDFKPGVWVGVHYDEPFGKNNGSVGGKKYFECPPKYGSFVRPSNVTVGDFPEEGFEDLDEM